MYMGLLSLISMYESQSHQHRACKGGMSHTRTVRRQPAGFVPALFSRIRVYVLNSKAMGCEALQELVRRRSVFGVTHVYLCDATGAATSAPSPQSAQTNVSVFHCRANALILLPNCL